MKKTTKKKTTTTTQKSTIKIKEGTRPSAQTEDLMPCSGYIIH